MPKLTEQDRATLSAAFPAALTDEVHAAITKLPALTLHTGHVGPMTLHGEPLRLFSRLYCEPWTCPKHRSTQHLILACLHTRHHDGFVRQAQLELLLGAEPDWCAPFVLALLGEPVIQLHAQIAQSGALQRPHYQRFAQENSPFMTLLRQRVLSYWNEYYRAQHLDLGRYPAMQALLMLGLKPPRRLRARLTR